MARISIFADESGNFDFSRKNGASRYFILTTVSCPDFGVGDALLDLRRELAWAGIGVESEFHATTDKLEVRARVFDLLQQYDFRVDATILEKAKAQPKTRTSDEVFYRYAWYYHMKHVAPRIVREHDELFVVGASLGTKKKRTLMHNAVRDVVQQVTPTVHYRTASWAAQSEPCLQVADYCCWAISRKWERGITEEYDRIAPRIATEFDLWRRGTKVHY